jgi:hypothetical protein
MQQDRLKTKKNFQFFGLKAFGYAIGNSRASQWIVRDIILETTERFQRKTHRYCRSGGRNSKTGLTG